MVHIPVAGQSWPAIIDTGFNGDLELPDGLRGPMNARVIGPVLSILGAGQQVVEDEYEVAFPLDGQTVLAEATLVTGQVILIDTHLLRSHRLEINFVARTVLLERVP